MGGTASTRRVTFEADENENITVVKGIRLSENVIDRMKETSPSGSKSQRYSGAYGASVSDEELKRRVAEELALEQAKKESENQKRLKQSKELDRERAFANEQLTRAILRERISSEEERAKAKHLAKQLEQKDRMIKKQDTFYKEQLARLEERVNSCSRMAAGALAIASTLQPGQKKKDKKSQKHSLPAEVSSLDAPLRSATWKPQTTTLLTAQPN
ncbi:MICOS complex subunit MIC19 isoform X3 [Pteropus vampyrus]|uniref:MICOS complex subunit MIC19 isoform X3 n=1 Tax=Pteropus vampyrus TaxID=132908 RepID=A0A6P6CFL6_PTEVA|nr:MICOS complex subunit MIC19 isoform X3 [Pteropus vampyrus]